MYLDPTIIGKTFHVTDPNIRYRCVGYAQNETFVVLGAAQDVPNNRSKISSFKLTEVTFTSIFADTLKS